MVVEFSLHILLIPPSRAGSRLSSLRGMGISYVRLPVAIKLDEVHIVSLEQTMGTQKFGLGFFLCLVRVPVP